MYNLTRPGYINSDDYSLNIIRKPKPPVISPTGAVFDTRSVEATIVLDAFDSDLIGLVDIYYSVDATAPSKLLNKYTGPVLVPNPGIIRAIVIYKAAHKIKVISDESTIQSYFRPVHYAGFDFIKRDLDSRIMKVRTVEDERKFAVTYTGEASKIEAVASMNQGRSYAGTFVIDDVMYVTGGYSSSGSSTNLCESFDTDSGVFSSIPSMQTPRAKHATFVYGSKGYVVGGYGGSDYVKTVEKYDKDMAVWTYVSNMPAALAILTCELLDGTVYCIGKADTSSTSQVRVYLYDLVMNTWSVADSSACSSTWYGNNISSAVYNGDIYVFATDTYRVVFKNGIIHLLDVNRYTLSDMSACVLNDVVYAVRNGIILRYDDITGWSYLISADANIKTGVVCEVLDGVLYLLGGTGGSTSVYKMIPSTIQPVITYEDIAIDVRYRTEYESAFKKYENDDVIMLNEGYPTHAILSYVK